jgi:hypothetical protein
MPRGVARSEATNGTVDMERLLTAVPRQVGRVGQGTIRIGFRAAGFGARLVFGAAATTVDRVLGRNGDGVVEAPPRPAPPEPPHPAAPPEPVVEAAPPQPAIESVPTPEPPAAEPESPPEPAHVSEEPTLVAESAEPGAENGAGAELRVDEPWPGYAKLTAAEIRDRFASASDEELAAIELYESTHRRRRTIIDAAADALRRRTVGR